MGCNEICKRYKAIGRPSDGRYKSGQKRCQVCVIYIQWDGLYCPCCNNRLRSKPRNRKFKAKLREALA